MPDQIDIVSFIVDSLSFMFSVFVRALVHSPLCILHWLCFYALPSLELQGAPPLKIVTATLSRLPCLENRGRQFCCGRSVLANLVFANLVLQIISLMISTLVTHIMIHFVNIFSRSPPSPISLSLMVMTSWTLTHQTRSDVCSEVMMYYERPHRLKLCHELGVD